jgi:hypothetical protein
MKSDKVILKTNIIMFSRQYFNFTAADINFSAANSITPSACSRVTVENPK